MGNKNHLIFLLLLFSFLVGGCSMLPVYQLPTAWPTNYLSTAIALTQTANPTSTKPILILQSTQKLAPTSNEVTTTAIISLLETKTLEVSPTPTLKYRKTPTITPTPTNPEAVIQLLSPGSLSKVTSPIQLEAYAQPGPDNRIIIELIGEDGRLIANEILFYQDLPRLWAPINLNLVFSINSVSELSRLQIRNEDQSKRTISLLSVQLILLSDGVNKIYPNTILEEHCIILSPKENEGISGGKLVIEGKFLPMNEQALIIDLIAESGAILGTTTIQIQSETGNPYIPFKTEVSYQVNKPTFARLTIHQPDERIQGDMFVFSQLILIRP
jgi:hypothetical protein